MAAILMNVQQDMSCIDVMLTLRGVTPQNDWTHSQQVWVSGYERYWNTEMAAIFINTPPGMICIDVMSTLRVIASHNDWIHTHGVWVSGHKRFWNNEMTAIFINTPPDMICIDTCNVDFVVLPLEKVVYTASRYEFQVINLIGINKWRLNECTTGYELHWCNIDFTKRCPSKRLDTQSAGMSFRI